MSHTPEATQGHTQTLKHILTTALLPSTLIAAALLAPQPHTPQTTPATEVTAQPQKILLTCLDAQIDPFNSTRNQPITPLIQPHDNATIDGQRLQWDSTQKTAFTALSVAAQAGGDLRGASITPCIQPQTQHWFAAGKTTPGEDTIIRVTNPGAADATVTMTLWGTHGPISTNEDKYTIPAGTSTTLRPGISATNEERIAIHLTTDGPAIGAWLLSSAINGEVPQGSAWITPTRPATQHTIPGIPTGTSTLRIANTNEKPTTISVEWVTTSERTTLPGSTIELAAGSITDLKLPTFDDGYATAIVTSDTHPIITQITTTQPGKTWPQGKTTWAARSLLTPVPPVTTATLPTPDKINAEITQQAQKTPLRPTSLPTASGLTVEKTHLIIANTGTTPAHVTIETRDTLTIAAGTHAVIDYTETTPQTPNTPIKVSSDTPVHMSLVTALTSPTGPITTIYPVTTPDLSHTTIKLQSY